MDSLKALMEKKRKEKEELGGAKDKKFVKRGEVEEAKLHKLREEDERERQAKLAKKGLTTAAVDRAGTGANGGAGGAPDVHKMDLSKEEVIRRLRKLGQPATLFGEDLQMRFDRLRTAEAEMDVEDEALGGQQVRPSVDIFTYSAL